MDTVLAALVSEAGHDMVYTSDIAPRAADADVMTRVLDYQLRRPCFATT